MKIKTGFSKERILEIYKKEEYFDAHCEVQENELLISADELKKRKNDDNLQILSVIENIETELPFEVNLKIPASRFDLTTFDLSLKKDIVIVCLKGISSYRVTKIIKKQFPKASVYSLKNGIENYLD